jgi:hypothetical protein
MGITKKKLKEKRVGYTESNPFFIVEWAMVSRWSTHLLFVINPNM